MPDANTGLTDTANPDANEGVLTADMALSDGPLVDVPDANTGRTDTANPDANDADEVLVADILSPNTAPTDVSAVDTLEIGSPGSDARYRHAAADTTASDGPIADVADTNTDLTDTEDPDADDTDGDS